MKTVLVPTDLSLVSQNASVYAARICRELGAEMILLHVYLLPVPVSELALVLESANEIHKANEEGLQKEAERISVHTGVEVKWMLRMGIASDEIGYLEKEKNIDLIVMGMNKEDGLHKLIGSTTSAVIRKCQRAAILVVPQHVHFAGLTSIAYATNLSYKMEITCFRPLITLIHHFQASLHLVHVLKEGEVLTPDQITGKVKLEDVLSDVSNQYHSIQSDNVEKGLEEFVQVHSPGMLTMVVHKHNLLERLFGAHHTQMMIRHTSIPLLILLDKSL